MRHLGDFIEGGGELFEQGGGALERRALGHVHHDLELALVVEGQHLEHHQLDEHHRRRGQDEQGHRAEEGEPSAGGAGAAQEGPHQAVEQGPKRASALGMAMILMPPEELEREPGCGDQGHGERKQPSPPRH